MAASRPIPRAQLPPPPPGRALLAPEIEEAHAAACEAGRQGYEDPLSGLFVFTACAHLKRGRCCGSKCRPVSSSPPPFRTTPFVQHF